MVAITLHSHFFVQATKQGTDHMNRANRQGCAQRQSKSAHGMRNRLGLLVVVSFLSGLVSTARADTTVFAAASLTDVLPALASRYVEQGGAPVRFSFASSSTLARQVENGAQAQLFISADEEWMAYLTKKGLIEESSTANLAGNELALITAADSALAPAAVSETSPLLAWLSGGRLALGDPSHVPAGRYAQAALEHLGLWTSVEKHLAPAESVRTALVYVSQGEAALGIVYASDLKRATGVKLIGMFPADSHPAIVYPAAVIKGVKDPEARKFLAFLRGPDAVSLWREFGFKSP
jgi:molybdate transport system substrate-binding protein